LNSNDSDPFDPPSACDLPDHKQAVPLSHAPLSSLVISMRKNENQPQRVEERAVPATSEGTPPYTDPLPGPDVATPDDTPRPTLPPRHMVDDADPSGNNPDDFRTR